VENAVVELLASQAGDGFAMANDLVLEDLQKALTAGYGTDAATFTGGRALMPESLDTTLVSVLHTQEEAKLFQRLKKQPVSSTVHQYVKRTEVGDDDGAFVAEGGNSQEKDQTLARKIVNMKYLQTKRQATIQAVTANTIEDAMAIEQNAATLWVIRNVEKTLFTGNSSFVTEQFDGLDALLTTHVLDMRGGDATGSAFENKVNESCRRIRDYFGKPSLMLSSTMVMEDIQKLLRDRIRVGTGEIVSGNVVFNAYPTKFGKPELEDDVFIKEGTTPVASTITASRPGAPTINSEAAGAHASSEFAAADAGAYWYKVVAVNAYGDSTADTSSSAVTVASGDRVTLNVTEGSPAATAYKVYRSQKGAATAADCRYAFTVARTAATQDIYDTNSFLPGTSSVYILTMEALYNGIEWNQFLPMMKFPLFPTAAAVYPFLMLLFGALNVKKEEQMVRIKNVAYSGMGWF